MRKHEDYLMRSHEEESWRRIIKRNHEEKHEEKHEDHLIESFKSCWENMKIIWLW